MLCVQRKRPRLPSIVLVGDPGPDPDDAKALLILGILGLQGVVRLRAVVCNGGGRPELRARLARALLDRIGSPCPVGVGSAGKAHAPSSYEFALTGFDDVDASRLEDGQTLLLRTLRAARDGSLTIVCISSLRDIADVMASEPALLRRKVCEVAVQGGLELDPVTKRYVPDSSTNNGFDPDAARAVYAFCFDNRLPLVVVSRDAVPMLPMQLARSFAVRSRSPVMAYLAAAQFLGLQSLWRRLCVGELPERCTKQWYFATFCGVSAADFVARGLDTVGVEATDIINHLDGHVKPYDVLALMAVLPITRHIFEQLDGAMHVHDGVTHRLYLRPEHAIPADIVSDLLRDVYRECVVLDDGSAASTGRSAFGSQGPHMPAFADALCVSMGLEQLASPSESAALSSPSADLHGEASVRALLDKAFVRVLTSRRHIAAPVSLLAATICCLALVQAPFDQAVTAVWTGLDRDALIVADAGFIVRQFGWSVLVVLAVPLCVLSMHWSAPFVKMAHSVLVSLVLANAALAAGDLGRMPTARGALLGYACARVALCVLACANGAVVARHWGRPRPLVMGVWRMLGASMFAAFLPELVRLLVDAASGTFRTAPAWVLPVRLLTTCPRLAVASAMLVPTRSAAYAVALFARISGAGREPLALIVPLLGAFSAVYGRDVHAIVSEATRAFAPAPLTAELLARAAAAQAQCAQAERFRALPRSATSRAPAHSARAVWPVWPEGASQSLFVAEYYIVHAQDDDVRAWTDELLALADDFAAAHGRPPLVYLAKACADPALAPHELLEHVPVYQLRAARLVILAGPALAACARSAVELVSWRVLSREPGAASVRRRSTGTRGGAPALALFGDVPAEQVQAVIASIDVYHASGYGHLAGRLDVTRAGRGLDAEADLRLAQAIQLADTSTFNRHVRAYLPVLLQARDARAARSGRALVSSRPSGATNAELAPSSAEGG